MFDIANYLSKLVNEPQWLKDKRTSAWEEYSKKPMPTTSEEGWRLLDLTKIDLEPESEQKQGTEQITKQAIAPERQKLSESAFQNIFWYKQISQFVKNPAAIFIESPQGIWCHLDEQVASQGVIFMPMSEAVAKHGDKLKPYLEQSTEAKYALLNQALCAEGMVIYVPENVVIDKPLVYLNLFERTAASPAMSRLLVVAREHAQLSVINVLVSGEETASQSESAKPALTNYFLQVHVHAGAKLNYAEVQNFDDNTFAITHSDCFVEKDASLNVLTAALGAGQQKGEICTNLQERGAESTLNGIVLGNKNERFNFDTIENHNAPDTTSSINFRVALKDEACSMYQGTIKVSKEAQKTDAFQSNKNLLLGGKAHADSIPKLEILADDVKCSHGATVGPVDRNQVFYLMSRGLSAGKAEELIVNGFFHQLVNDCPIEGVADWLDSLVGNKIEADTIYGAGRDNSQSAEQKANNKDKLADKQDHRHPKNQPALTR